MLVLLGTIFFIAIFYLIAVRPFDYWKKRGIEQYPIWKIWIYVVKQILQWNPPVENIKKTYSNFPDRRYIGIYVLKNPLLLIRDPDLIKQIGVKDFEHFVDHFQFINEEIDPLWGRNLLALKGDRWKDMRTTLTPSFTSSKMKMMFGLISECADKLVEHFKGSETITVELKDVFTRYTNDVIASVAFGVSCNSLEDRENEFYVMGREATNVSGFRRNASFMTMILFPKLAKLLGLTIFSKKTGTFFRTLVKENLETREKHGIVRQDMLHLLMEAKHERLKQANEESTIKKPFSDDDLTAQALIFFFAGFESVSTLMCFTGYELAIDPLIQKKLQDEVDATWEECNGKLTYEALQKMEYLDMVLSETLRKWPSAIATDRMCVKPYTIQPERDGEKPVHLKVGDIVWIPIAPIHYDEKFHPDPDRFNPERFSHDNKGNIHPYSYMPFGVGPRNCIGNRFALLETKILFFNILRNFNIVVVDKSEVPIKLSRKQFNIAAENGFWFGFSPRQTNL